ncbi:hypothetical protein HII31_02830 [Pseudocercospora fuligena]|uniref:Uncharacterized protein n=1 Tax=Pseudocercospora fuligena TaxID=685502 RepID=A0A8H6RR41_9PEZI|nr:hypothetical protein HII31_02830 [Pseudocercospora fuligena]
MASPNSSAKGTEVAAAMPAQAADSPSLPLYVLIPPSPLFAAHGSLFVPDTSSFDIISRRQEDSSTGRRIHVSGDRLNGFHLEIIRNYDINKHKAVGTRRFKIGLIPSRCLSRDEAQGPSDAGNAIQKDDEEGGGNVDNRPTDDFERAVLEIEAPGPSLNSAQSAVGSDGRRMKAEVKDCQWWVREVVRHIFEQGLLMPLNDSFGVQDSKGPLEMVESLPVH